MNFVLAAGGTGGHMIPAHALAVELNGRGHGVMLITDDRGARFPGLFPGMPVQILPAGRLGGNPVQLLKALINMMVNVQLAPSKGMTLPFISYGGSSMLALSIGMGLLLAFTRRNPYLTRSPYVVKWSGESLTA